MRALLLAFAAATFLSAMPAQAEWNPSRPVKIIVPYPPGGASDVAARSLTERVGQKLGQPVLVENRPGAGGVLGTDSVYRAEPDGYTLLLGASDGIAIAPLLQPDLTKYKPEAFVPIAPVNQVNTILVTRPGLGVKNVPELLALARKGKLSYSSWGNGSLGHVAAEVFRSTAQIDLLNVPYQGAAPAAQAVLTGQVDLMFMPGPLWLTFRDRVTTLGATSPGAFQNVQSLTSQGVPVVVDVWQGIIAPPKTPRPVVERLHKAFAEALNEPDLKDKTLRTGSIPLSMTQQEFADMVSADLRKWKKMLADNNIRPQ